MKFFFPDSLDMVDPSFDFVSETRSMFRNRQRDDLYAHEVFKKPPFDGILLSKAAVDGIGSGTARYSIAQRHRLLREGIHEFFRLKDTRLETMGDCGAFSYVREKTPPYSVSDVIDFYVSCGFDYGVSVDHVILAYQEHLDDSLPGIDLVSEDWRARQALTLELAKQFREEHRRAGCRFVPVGVAQGWSPKSYAEAVKALQKMGYTTIAVGGLVPLRTTDILALLAAANDVRKPSTRFHLFGVTRCEHVATFRKYGVASFDSTSPLRQAFKDDKDNYYTPEGTYSAIRVPQVDGNAVLRRRIQAGQVDQARAVALEKACLARLNEFSKGRCSIKKTLDALCEYESLHDPGSNRYNIYRQILTDKPWTQCPCEICRQLGIHVIIFRGAERNRRRGFHNLYVFWNRLHAKAGRAKGARRVSTKDV